MDNSAQKAEQPADTPEKPKERKISKGPGLRSRLKKKSYVIPTSLEEVRKKQEELREQQGEEEEEELIFAYDTSIQVDEARFKKGIEVIRAELKKNKKASIASTLDPQFSELDHNRWIQKVNSNHQKQMLEEQKWVVAKMRELSGEPRLMLEIRIEEIVLASDSKPYTLEDRLKAMEEKNPALKLLMKKFDTMVEY